MLLDTDLGALHGCTKTAACLKRNSTVIDIGAMIKYITQTNLEYSSTLVDVISFANLYRTPLLSTRYEDLLRDADTLLQQHVLPFLSLEAGVHLTARGVKRAGNLTHKEMIENFEAVVDALAKEGMSDLAVDEAARKTPPDVILLNA